MNTDNYIDKKINKYNYMIIFILIAIVAIICYLLMFQDLFKDPYVKQEEDMVEIAINYVEKNNVSTYSEIYLDAIKLDIDLPNECSITSGVIYDGANYIPNLVCNDYQSVVIKSNKEIEDFIKLKGNDVMIIPKGNSYYEPGYISNDIVSAIGSVGTEEGVYNVFYKTNNSNRLAIRKVIVIDNNAVSRLFPIINLMGDDVIYLVQNEKYVEPGVTGYDLTDGDISNNIQVEGTVNTKTPGEYTLTYVLTNSLGNSNVITRKVHVLSSTSDLVVDYRITPETDTNKNVIIKLSISGNYTKIVYPNGTEGKGLSYAVKDNGVYNFIVYDDYNRTVQKSVEIKNIDRAVPEGTCVATTYYNKTDVKVNITSSRTISSYSYILDGSTLANIQSSSYVSNKVKPSSVSVKIKDSLGNSNVIVCSIANQTERKIVTNSKGKNCLEGLACYVQYDYQNTARYPFCSMSGDQSSCGGIGQSGCSITATTNAIAAMGVKSRSGALYNPYTVYDELYPIHANGTCNGGCSAWERMRDAVINAGLSAPANVGGISASSMSTIINHLRKGYPVIVWAKNGAYTSGGHYMALLGVRSDGYVFLSDSANSHGTFKSNYNGHQYHVDTWISTNDLINGNVREYLLVGPKGMF